MTLISFLAFMALFLVIGLLSFLRAKQTKRDYYLADRDVSPWMTGLSAVATNNSGYMFIGVIGYTYAVGLASIWLMVGWILGDYLASTFVHRELRKATMRTDEASFSAVLARWGGAEFAVWRRLAAIVTIIFLGAYAAAQISAGGKALHGVFDWAPETGAILVAAIVLAYSVAGGLRASIWTDTAQSAVMICAMALLLIVGVYGLGGIGNTIDRMGEVAGFLDWFPDDLLFPGAIGMILFVAGWMFAGLSVIGQPHIMVRFMALDELGHMRRARAWYYGYFIPFYLLATGVGMLSRVYLPELGGLDPELALPTMARELLPPVLVGLILAGIFAATMSTADSLVLSCSAALTHDLLPRKLERNWELKGATALITLFALIIALGENQSVFSLVILAWSTLASAFGPLLILYALGRTITERYAILIMIIGVSTALYWRYLDWHLDVYEGAPAILLALIIGWLLSEKRAPQTIEGQQPLDEQATA